MFYEINHQMLCERAYDKLHTDALNVGYLTCDQLGDCYEALGFDSETYEQCNMKTATFQNPPLIYSTYSYGLLHIINIEDPSQPHSKLAFYMMKHLLLIVDLYSQDDRTKHAFEELLERAITFPEVTLPQLFTIFFTTFFTNDYQGLELLDLKLETLEKKVMHPHLEHLQQELFHYRRQLLILRNYYEQFLNIAEDIVENTNHLIEPDELMYVHLFQSRVRRLSEHTRDLSEYLTQIKESYMAQLDIHLNHVMKLFTIVTSIFMPLTLIVGWYGMNFKYMPELSWEYGYVYVIVLCAVVTALSILWFKKKHYL